MINQRKKRISLLLALSLAFGLLTGCAGKTQRDNPADPRDNLEKLPMGTQAQEQQASPAAAESYDALYKTFEAVRQTAAVFETTEKLGLQNELQVNQEIETYGEAHYAQAQNEAPLTAQQDGYLYMLSGSELMVIQAAGAQTQELGRTFVVSQVPSGYQGSETPKAIYVSGNRAFVVTYECLFRDVQTEDGYQYESLEKVHVKQFDLSDPQNPTIVSDFSQSGQYLRSLVAGERLYLLSAYSVWQPDAQDASSYVPMVTHNGEDALLEPADITICPGTDSADYTVVTAVDLQSGQDVCTRAMTGHNAWSVTDGEALYLARTSYQYAVEEGEKQAQYAVTDYSYRAFTQLMRLSLSDTLSVDASGVVEGALAGEGALELAQDGTVYVATSAAGYAYQRYYDADFDFENFRVTSSAEGYALYALDRDLAQLRACQQTENIYGAYFLGNTAYLLGFDTLAPQGYADMTQQTLQVTNMESAEEAVHNFYPFGEGRSIGIGIAQDESGAATGLTLALYDTSGAVRSALGRVQAAGDWSQAINAPGSVLTLADRQLVALPTADGYQLYTWQDGWQSAGSVAMNYIANATSMFVIGDNLYFCNDAMIEIVDAASYTHLAKIEFAYG